jgi:putative membrane protein
MTKRRPAAFRLDDPDVALADDESRRAAARVLVTPELPPEPELPAVVVPPPRRRRFPFATVFWSAASGLVALALGLALTSLIEELFSRAEWLGWFGAVLAGLSAFALAAIAGREIVGLVRLGTLDALRNRAAATLVSDDRGEGLIIARELLALFAREPRLAQGRARLDHHLGDIIDGRDLVQLAEQHLLAPLDAEARRLVSNAAKRVSIVTAVSPRAAVDLIFVFITALGLMRRLARLYGGRPGVLGMIRLAREVVAHLTVTGGLALSDSLLQQMIGHGVAAKLSARLGEGVLNGLLTARLGLAAIEVTRPLPFAALPQPTINDLAGALLTSEGRSRGTGQPE